MHAELRSPDLIVGEMYDVRSWFMNHHINLNEDSSEGIGLFLGMSNYSNNFLIKGKLRHFDRASLKFTYRYITAQAVEGKDERTIRL